MTYIISISSFNILQNPRKFPWKLYKKEHHHLAFQQINHFKSLITKLWNILLIFDEVFQIFTWNSSMSFECAEVLGKLRTAANR